MGEIFRRIQFLLSRRERLEELENDMAFHREMAAREGKTFGNAPRLQEEAREAWGWTWIDRLLQDLRFALRVLMRAPAFTITAVLVLAVGIGVNLTAFSLFNLAVLKPLPVRDPDSLLRFERRSEENIGMMPYVSASFYRDHAKTLSAVMVTMGGRLALDGSAQPASANFVSANYFSELGILPLTGRILDPVRDEANNAPPVAVLSYSFWQHQFAGDPSMIGKTIRLNRKAVTIVGILPYAFGSLGGDHADVWVPITLQPYFVEGSKVLTEPGMGATTMWGRLAPGATPRAAEEELKSLATELRRQYPKATWDGEYVKSYPGGRLTVIQPPLTQLVATAAVLVFLILAVACANLGGLMVARGVTREHEMSIRMSIGASRTRIFRQLFTESLLLSVLGSLAAMLLSCLMMRVILVATNAPAWMPAYPDWRVLCFTAVIAFVAAICFGFLPALQVARQVHRRTLARQTLIGAQVAASCVLLILAGLLVRAVVHALYTDPGFGYERVLSIDPALSDHGYTPAGSRVYLEQLETRLRAFPGVTSVGMSQMTPLNSDRVSYMQVTVHGRETMIYPDFIDPDFFRTMDIPLIRGRNLLPAEDNAVIVSEALARREWPGEDPIGKKFSTDDHGGSIVVGVAKDAHLMAVNDSDATELYIPAKPKDMDSMALVVKTAGDPDALPKAIQSMAGDLDPKVFPTIRLLKEGFHSSVLQVEEVAATVSVMGFVAVSLAGIGMLGLVAFTVSQRMKEIAIRLALGAGRWQIIVALLRQFAWAVGGGLVAGTAIAVALSHVLRRFLFGISNLDPFGYAGAIGTLLAMIVVAAVLPARRSLRIDVAKALHYE